MTELSDEEIVIRARTDNPEIFGEIVRRYEARLYRYVSYLLQDEIHAHDIVQDTFIKAFRNLQSFNTNLKFSSWIYRIAHNEAINKIKKNSKEIFNYDFDFLGETLLDVDTPDETFEKDEIKRGLKVAMEQLSVKYREVLSLYYLEDRSYEEISDILQVSIGTVGTWINRGKANLKKIIKGMNNSYF